MKKIVLTAAISLFVLAASPANAQSMQDQLKALESAENDIKAKQEARRQEYQRQQEAQAAQERVKRAEEQARMEKQREEDARNRRIASEKAEAIAKQQREAAAKERDKKEAYNDELKRMALEEKQLELQVKKAKVKRADDYIDQELNREKAKTDVIQSDADANRNVSTGAKNMMTGIGKGEENKTKGWSLFKKND
jgi:hypothetical protein